MIPLKTMRGRRDIQRRLDEQPLPETPRDIAIEWLSGKIRDGNAGLDVYDPAVFIVDASENERVWAYRCLDLVGHVLARVNLALGGQWLRAILEADARVALELDTRGHWMTDEPLASRAVGTLSAAERLVAGERAMDRILGSLDPERESTEAIRRAFYAYDRNGGFRP